MRFAHNSLPGPPTLVAALDIQPLGDREWAVLAADSRLVAFDSEGRTRNLAQIELSPIDPTRPVALHLSRDARFAAVANRYGRYGKIVDLPRATSTLALDRGDYGTDVSVHPLAFFEHEDRTLVVHATDWNRLDVSEPTTGRLLTPREPTACTDGEDVPPHYLDYFHGGLSAAPGGRWIADNGWIWHPRGEIRTWALDKWIESNPWESEDGESVGEFCSRTYFWDGPLCWIDGTTLAVWGAGEDEEEMLPAIRLIDVTSGQERRSFPGPDVAPHTSWPPGSAPTGWIAFNEWLFAVSPEHGTGVWDVRTGERMHHEPGFVPDRYHPGARCFLSIHGGEAIVSRLVD